MRTLIGVQKQPIEGFVAWRWDREGSRQARWSKLHLLDPERPGYTKCGALAGPNMGTPDHSHTHGIAAMHASAPSGLCIHKDHAGSGCFRYQTYNRE